MEKKTIQTSLSRIVEDISGSDKYHKRNREEK
jgi:hypothetical protein